MGAELVVDVGAGGVGAMIGTAIDEPRETRGQGTPATHLGGQSWRGSPPAGVTGHDGRESKQAGVRRPLPRDAGAMYESIWFLASGAMEWRRSAAPTIHNTIHNPQSTIHTVHGANQRLHALHAALALIAACQRPTSKPRTFARFAQLSPHRTAPQPNGSTYPHCFSKHSRPADAQPVPLAAV
ncbi:hypothetical protein P171DRAFT_478585 [Karstenula rhodostoma CBS 690.94]|uniref:Uncharacterized protein n=1 Tax=Karstenula rhodostoma CBS 690.94 TaxID=1392251 RepID=A0A9P4PYI7_9PLEO|nr:hypothetical protein P171DRAFT_478585 [Karstenula rhodostoma CBS 690.94]